MSYKLVQFANGNYGIQKREEFLSNRGMYAKVYYDFRSPGMWWSLDENYIKDCQTPNLVEANRVYYNISLEPITVLK